jgi:thiamine biosynthesis lipoprotein
MRSLTRRQFLYVSAALGGSTALAAACGNGGLDKRHEPCPDLALQTVTRTSRALGAEVAMTALHQDRRTAAAAVDAAFAELELVEELMSIYRPQSQLSRLNRDGVLDSPHPYIVAVLRYAQDLAERTEGAFDVTVQPLWSVYRHAARRGELPQERELAAARAMVGWRRLSVTAERLTLEGGAQITLNGIAQGFAADCALRALRSLGVEHALVDTGELGALGRKANGEKWTVGIQHPRVPDAYISLAQLQRRFLGRLCNHVQSGFP